MIVNVFDIQDSRVVINTHCLLLPELKAIVDTYDDPIPPLCYIHFFSHPKSPYINLSVKEREKVLLEDYPGDYTLEDPQILQAIEKIKKLYKTPTMNLRDNARIGLDSLSEYLATAKITEGKDSNLTGISNALSKISRIAKDYRDLEKLVDEELGTIRGDAETGYDEI